MNTRTRINRSKQMIRMVRPLGLTPSELIYPIFVREDGKNLEIPSLKGQHYLSIKDTVKVCEHCIELGIPAVMIFAILERKDKDGLCALEKNNFNLKVFRTLKKELKDDIVLISNVCLCTYTNDEYCVYTDRKGKVLHEKSAIMLGKISRTHAEAGADVIAPAAMVDGQVKHIRESLDDAGYDDIPIMSYIKSDSCLFEPYFKAMSTRKKPRVGIDTSKFRCDPLNARMFMQKLDLDIREGADIVIIKPAITNLDIISLTRQMFPSIPVAAYQVSGEYAMMHSAIRAGYLKYEKVILETLKSIRRAGADMILTYDATNICEYL
jgi:porphobilinogen synthase